MTMLGSSAKRRRTEAVASACCAAFYNLPPELLKAIFGFLDVRTLCTARLVCAQFRGAASWCLHSVELSVDTLRSRPEITLGNFPNLSRVTVFDVEENDLPLVAQSPIADAITHLQATKYVGHVTRRARKGAWSPLPRLPSLISLSVSHAAGRGFRFPESLRELVFEESFTCPSENLVYRLTKLTRLRIDVLSIKMPFEAVTRLTALQRLEICCKLTLSPFLAELTMLTHLQIRENRACPRMVWDVAPGIGAPGPSRLALAFLTRLHRLVHLGIGPLTVDSEDELLQNIVTMTSLRSLDLRLCHRPERSAFLTVCMAPFSQLTALRLESYGLDASFKPRFNMERLQHLSLSLGVKLHRDGVAALKHATGLTQLELWEVGVSLEELGVALACMPKLRALSMSSPPHVEILRPQAIGLLTELTRLECRGGNVSPAHMEMCLGLRKLRVLSVLPLTFSPARSDGLGRMVLFEIAKLPELSKLNTNPTLWSNRFNLTDSVRAWLDAERHEKGWPPLDMNIVNWP